MFGIGFSILTLLAAIPLIISIFKSVNGDEISQKRWYFSVATLSFVVLCELALIVFLSVYGESLWFEDLGYSARFWKALELKLTLFAIGFAGTTFLAYIFFKVYSRMLNNVAFLAGALSLGLGFLMSLAFLASWDEWFKFLNQVPGPLTDPIFNLNESFYLFSLPLYNRIKICIYFYIISMGLGTFSYACIGEKIVKNFKKSRYQFSDEAALDHKKNLIKLEMNYERICKILAFWVAMFCFSLIFGEYLDKFKLMFSAEGVVQGMGYTDFHARLPARTFMMGFWLILGVLVMVIGFSKTLFEKFFSGWKIGVITLTVLVLTYGFFNYIWPFYSYKVNVRPNEIEAETPFIKHNKLFTRAAFKLAKDNIVESEFPVSSHLDMNVIRKNKATLDNARLWDPRALHAVLTQTQEIRHYYEFFDVDLDRYLVNGQNRQVMVSARELAIDQLPKQAKTWINKHFKYTHGYGLTMNPVNTFQYNGNPELWVKDVPAVSTFPELKIVRPEIYFGEMTDHHIFVNTKEKEFDYPNGSKNSWTMHEGSSGVTLSSFLRKLAFAWKFDGHKIFFSDYLTSESRIIYRRNIKSRMKALCPFLDFDKDAYPVIHDGGITWIQDAYTTSTFYPYSEEYSKINYVRNSIKATMNAYDGTVNFYVFDDTDPIIKTWMKIFPNLFRSASEMPQELRRHIRYPKEMFKIQHEVFRKYHIDDVQNFFNQEDRWDLPTEKYRSEIIPVEPYFILVQLLEEKLPEYMLMNPYTVKGKDRMTSWMSALCDGDDYGKLVLYKFPKGQFIAGPQQIEAKIDSDEDIAKELTLWDQKGSEVIRGNMIILPLLGNVLVSFEPVFLQGESARIPKLTRIVMAQILPGDQKVVWDKTFDSVIRVLLRFKGDLMGPGARAELGEILTSDELIDKALDLMDQYQELTGKGEYGEAGAVLQSLHVLLREKQTTS